MDWKGLLNWSMKYQDGTVDKNLKPMSEEDSKFIEAAFESICVNEMKEIMKILDKLKETELETTEDEENRLNLLDDLIVLIDGLENARNIVRAKRFSEIVNYFFSTKSKAIKLSLGSILTTMMQNDKYVQTAAIELGIFKILGDLNNLEDKELIGKYIYILTGLLYGEFADSKKIFIEDFDGLKLMYNLLMKNFPSYDSDKNLHTDFDSKKFSTFRRILGITKELTKIEDKEAENYSIRFLSLNSIKEIEMHQLILKILATIIESEGVKGGFKSHDVLDSVKLLLEIIGNVSNLFDNTQETLNYLLGLIKEVNTAVITTDSSILTEDDKKSEKDFLIERIKVIKREFGKGLLEPKELDSTSTIETTSTPLMIESNDQIAKGSCHIQLK